MEGQTEKAQTKKAKQENLSKNVLEWVYKPTEIEGNIHT